MQCPKCHGLMEPVTHAGVTADRCRECGGLWFDGMEHVKFRKAGGAAVVDRGDENTGRLLNALRGFPCPSCATVMEVRFDPYQHHIHYEKCPQAHGAYFDAGEFRDYVTDDWTDFFKGLFTSYPRN